MQTAWKQHVFDMRKRIPSPGARRPVAVSRPDTAIGRGENERPGRLAHKCVRRPGPVVRNPWQATDHGFSRRRDAVGTKSTCSLHGVGMQSACSLKAVGKWPAGIRHGHAASRACAWDVRPCTDHAAAGHAPSLRQQAPPARAAASPRSAQAAHPGRPDPQSGRPSAR